MERLDKILSDAGIGSRKELRHIISSGLVRVNGIPVTDAAGKFDRDSSVIQVNGVTVNTAKYRYFAICKPKGVLTATEDSHQKTVLDLLPAEIQRLGLFPVGRLDKDTTGLLILTNDGEYAHRVISPGCHVNKVYLADVEREAVDGAVLKFQNGLVLADGTECEPALLEKVSPFRYKVTIHEGKYHQVKRMMAAVGAPVAALRRISIGSMILDESEEDGNWWELTPEEAGTVFL